MANVVILGGGFSGVVAAESLVKRLGDEHQITLVSRSRKFLFHPALVRLAFGRCEPDDIQFDVRETMGSHRIRFVEGDVARIYPEEQLVKFAHGDFIGEMPYDYLVLALGRRLRTELVGGFFEHAHHLLDTFDAEKFGKAVGSFHKGQAVIGYCADARLPVPAFETAFELARILEERGERSACTIKILSAEGIDEMFGGVAVSSVLNEALQTHGIEFVSDFVITRVTPTSVVSSDGRKVDYDLNMIIPPFGGPGALVATEIVDNEGYVLVDSTMRVRGVDKIYAVGDCVSFQGPKMGHMAVRQGEVAAENLALEIQGKPLTAKYDHELTLVIDAGGNESTFVQKDLWTDEPANIQQSRFWGWAKRKQEQYWKIRHA